MTCKLGVPSNGKTVVYTCDEVRELFDTWIDEFKRVNRTDEILAKGMKDRRYEEYRRELEQFLANCRCKSKYRKMPEVSGAKEG